ncbi:Lachesin [Holothuria leucospilota]|uniref:Lachesin n=1 Tax=Holothuria leucospilota TaxID=206669 RepID=A0A9Q1HF83_HOLLE|nr:Lachesin [Holothuria leucospilota]
MEGNNSGKLSACFLAFAFLLLAVCSTTERIILCKNKTIRRKVPARCAEYLENLQCNKLLRCIKSHYSRGNGSMATDIKTLPGRNPVNSTREGETVHFECKIFNANESSYHVSWWRNGDILFLKDTLVPLMDRNESSRYRVHMSGNNTHVLTILDISRHIDEGVYACKFNVNGNQGFEHFFHLNFIYSPEVDEVVLEDPLLENPIHRPDPLANILVFNETANVTLRCLASGNPSPFINWTRSGSKLPLERIIQTTDDVITIVNVSRYDNGRYTCQATNSLGESASNYVDLKVQYPPIIKIPATHITGVKSKTVLLECKVFAEPPATKLWFKDGVLVEAGINQNRLFIAVDEDSTKLDILRVIPDIDYGNYTCRATNMLGSTEGYINLNGLPTDPKIVSKNFSHHRNSYTLEWYYEQAADENRVLYFTYCYLNKQLYVNSNRRSIIDNVNAPCFNVTVPPKSKQRMFRSKLIDLFPNAQYMLELYVVNQYGRGDVAKHTFETPDVDISSTPSTCTFHVGDPRQLSDNSALTSAECNVQLLFLLLLAVVMLRLRYENE